MTGQPRIECRCKRTRHVHGTRACFQQCGCTCLPCRFAYDEAVRLGRHGIYGERWQPCHSRVGTRRRIEALHAVGWSGAELGRRLGVTCQAVYHLRGDQPIFPGTAERVAALYDELWNAPPVGTQVRKTRNWAARNGWLPPLAWDDADLDDPNAEPAVAELPRRVHDLPVDEVAVARAVAGDPPDRLTRQERLEAVRRLTALGVSAEETARRLRTSPRAVVRDRSEAA